MNRYIRISKIEKIILSYSKNNIKMGNYFFKSSQPVSATTPPMQVIVETNSDKFEIHNLDEVKSRYGEPTRVGSTSDTFFAHSYQEDCFLMGNGRNYCDTRYEWQNNGRYVVLYFKDGKVVKMFE